MKGRLPRIYWQGFDANSNLEKTPTADDRMVLIGLIEQDADKDLMRETPAFTAKLRMDLEIEARTDAPCAARKPL